MASASNYLENALLNHVFRSVPYANPSQVYLALYLSDPTDADTGTEVTGGGYARQPISFAAPVQVSDEGTISNSARIDFPVATSAWGTIVFYGIRDALTGGNLLVHGSLIRSREIQSGDQATFDLNALTVSLK